MNPLLPPHHWLRLRRMRRSTLRVVGIKAQETRHDAGSRKPPQTTCYFRRSSGFAILGSYEARPSAMAIAPSVLRRG